MYNLKNILSSLVSSLEWYDFALYGYFGSVLAENFYPKQDVNNWIPLIAIYGIFSVGFVARPIGALLFGYLGDKFGRAKALKLTPIPIMVVTIGIGLLPTYEYAGDMAILFLALLRIFQGILVGGEFAGNMVYLCESSRKWRYVWGSVASCSGSFGIILASVVSSFLHSFFSKEFIYSYGWRIAFFLALPLGVISYFFRSSLKENENISNENTARNPIIETIKNHKITLLICIGIICLHAVSFYFVFVFLPIFLVKLRGFTESASLINNTLFLVIHLLIIPVFGLIIQKKGGLRSLKFISFLFLVCSVPLCYLISYSSNQYVIGALGVFSIMTSLNAAIIPGLLTEITPIHVRYTVLAFSFNVSFGILGGLTPFVCLLLINKTGNIMLPSFYLTAAALVTFSIALIYRFSTRRIYEIREVFSN